MGYLTQQIADEVGRLTQERGRQYFLRGAVESIEGDNSSVTAVVRGTMRYHVQIKNLDEFIDYSCNCPFFERDFEPCKHIWAAALEAEQHGYLRGREKLSSVAFHSEHQPSGAARSAASASGLSWQKQLEPLFHSMALAESRSAVTAPAREFIYIVDGAATASADHLIIEVAQRELRSNGTWGKLKTHKLRFKDVDSIPNTADRRIIAMLVGSLRDSIYDYSPYYQESVSPQFSLPPSLWEVVLPLICATGRSLLRVSNATDELLPLSWDDGEPWEFYLRMAPAENGAVYRVCGELRRGEIEMSVAKPLLMLAGGLVFSDGRVARLNDHRAFAWIALLRQKGELSIPKQDSEAFLAEILRFAHYPRLELPEELRFEEIALRPKPKLLIKPGPRHPFRHPRLLGKLGFDYEGHNVFHNTPGNVYDQERRRLIRRDLAFESAARRRMIQIGFRTINNNGDANAELYADQLPKVVRSLTQEGWEIEAEGKLYRTAEKLKIEVKSGVDWFELDGSAIFGEAKISLPQLLRAIQRGESMVKLDDGSLGVLPEEWMKKYGLLAGLGDLQDRHLRFTRPQAGLLDALLAGEPAVSVDAVFARFRQELRDFSGIAAAEPPPSFTGKLRAYQSEGLGWLLFLERFGFGGCLADDMGLGKTIQVLALLEARREQRPNGKENLPSLVVVPRSLVFHWKKEASAFAPKLLILDHTGATRLKPGDHFADYDVVLTTYGTLRRDALPFKDQHFDYCILDEAQAIKNSGTLSAKAVRLLRADHRLAMSGTPVENHLGELWSLFEFLNPGMLGSVSIMANAGRSSDEETRAFLRKAFRPFILRRTKSQVATELPEKTEQTLYCDLESDDRKLYNELRDYYRSRLLKRDPSGAPGQFKLQVLEALLRLRQVACHPGLVDKRRIEKGSAKLDTLLAQLDQVLEENHKVLVFSQFTSLLAIVRARLDAAEIPYAYLDGRTRDREARVEQFQKDPNTKLFLISLKAGGVGLNLHAAEYVYLLDPWWNPAVEAQAIDRAHRIGQTRQVFAYRLIARDTVEEKVLELQKAKRDLADAIISADNSVIRNLTREDLELLLS
jgi:superfamily II DNA or RNA helicase